MPPPANTTERGKVETQVFSAEVQNAVRAEVEAMLKTPIFAQSGRCKRFLSYVVLETLEGNANHLKERTIGISVFDRANDYDTGDDSIVRVTANEVRKRIGQFYRESDIAHPIQIGLPRGSYVPEFRIQPLRKIRKPEEAPSFLDSSDQVTASYEAPVLPEQVASLPDAAGRGSGESTESEVVVDALNPSRHFPSRPRVYLWGLVVLLLFATASFGIWRLREKQGGPQIWEGFLNAKAPILICIDTHDLHLQAGASPDGQKFVDSVLHKQIIALDDAEVLASMAALFGRKGIPFRVVGADGTSLTDFRRQPVVLIGAIDNKWTVRLTQSLRYRIEVANPPGSATGKEPIASIVDSSQSGVVPLTVDLSIPFAAWKNDYAIVAKMDDNITGVPVLIEAGLGNDGSLAASELVTSGALTTRLADEPLCKSKSNFEAVIGTEIIDTRSGPPHVLHLTCW